MIEQTITVREDKLAPYRGRLGLDLLDPMLRDERLRPTMVEGVGYISLVGLMDVFGDRDTIDYSPREFWRDQKRRLKKRKPELWEKISQLRLVAEDGKRRMTDVADLETCLRVLLYMNTPSSDMVKDLAAGILASMTRAAINYRIHNIMRGMERNADTIHAEMSDLAPPEPERPYADWGYTREWGR